MPRARCPLQYLSLTTTTHDASRLPSLRDRQAACIAPRFAGLFERLVAHALPPTPTPALLPAKFVLGACTAPGQALILRDFCTPPPTSIFPCTPVTTFAFTHYTVSPLSLTVSVQRAPPASRPRFGLSSARRPFIFRPTLEPLKLRGYPGPRLSFSAAKSALTPKTTPRKQSLGAYQRTTCGEVSRPPLRHHSASIGLASTS